MGSAKDFLNRIRIADLMINAKVEQIGELRAKAEAIGAVRYDKDKVQSSMSGDNVLDCVAKIIELEKELDNDIDALVDMKRVALSRIQSMQSDVEKLILFERYFNGNTFEQIAVKCNYSWRQVHRIHGRALKHFESVS